FSLGFSEDGKTWVTLAAPALPDKTGMVSRSLPAPPSAFRYVKVRATGPSGRVACAELQLLCGAEILRAEPDAQSQTLEEEQAGVDAETALDARKLDRSVLVSACLAVTLLLLALRKRALGSTRGLTVWLVALALTATFAFGAYLKLGPYGFPPHRHELFHYELGAKYFAELGYDGLYDCAVAAEFEAGFADRALKSTYRDLRTNALIPVEAGLSRAEACRARFSPARWREFRADIGYFARSLGAAGFREALWDHGYNPSPLWTSVGSALEALFGGKSLANAPASAFHAHPLLPLLDLALLLGALVVVGLGFGFEPACLVAVALACNTLADPSWTRGAFLRFLWLFSLFAGLAALKKERPAQGVFWLVLSAGFRAFPALALAPIAAYGAYRYAKTRTVPEPFVRAALGASAGVAAILALTALGPGLSSWASFFDHAWLHAQTVSQNHVGFRTALSYRPSTRANVLFDRNALDPFLEVIRARHENLRPLLPLYWGGILCALALLGWRLLRPPKGENAREPTLLELALAGLLLVGIAGDLSSYYFAVLAVFALRSGRGVKGPAPVLGLLFVLSLLPHFGALDDTSFAIASVLLCLWLSWQLWSLRAASETPGSDPISLARAFAVDEPAPRRPWLPDGVVGRFRGQHVVLALVTLLALVAVGRAALGAWTCDDAYISFRYAEHLVEGKGLVYNAGERVEGFTNLLFTLLLAAGLALSAGAVATALVVGLVAYVGVALTLVVWSEKTRVPGRLWIPIAAIVWLIQDDLLSWATGGLETSLFTLLALSGTLLVLRAEGRRGRLLAAGTLLGLACATRPDGIIFTAVASAACVGLAWGRFRALAAAARECAFFALPLACLGAALVAFKLSYYGSLLPAPYYAKSALDAHYSQGVLYVGLYFFKHWPLTLCVLALPVLLVRARALTGLRDHGDLWVLSAAAGLFLLYVMHSAGDFMFARRVVPAIPFALLSVELMLEKLGGFGATLVAGALAALSFAPRELYPEKLPLRIHGIANEPAFYPPETLTLRREQGAAARAALRDVPVKAAFAGGMCVFAYYSKLAYLVEPNGLTNLTLAKAPLKERGAIVGHEKAVTRDTLRQMGLELLFQKTEVPPGPPAYDQVYFGKLLVAEILRYDRGVMSALAKVPTVRFQPIDATLDETVTKLRTEPCPEARRTLATLKAFYLDGDPPALERMQALLRARCETP
ncbi:MAG TPA: hypothetical protein VNN72_10400, partial [Polyangiaceae bacterium]|nr:hypothetical protein [Polyangiaceae bacterium]